MNEIVTPILAALIRGQELSPEEIDHALDPANYLGSTDQLIDRALAAFNEVRALRDGVQTPNS